MLIAAWTNHDWAALGSYVVLGMTVAALIFSGACFFMLRTILRHVIQFDPKSCMETYEHAMKQRAERRRRITDKVQGD